MSSERPGQITSDSLAAESLNSGGDFASGDATASSVPSYSTTANTTDSSGAAMLDPSRDAPSRDDNDFAQRDFPSADSEGGVSSGYDSARGAPAQNVGVAPSYVHAGGVSEEDGQPKGKNLTEGGAVDVDAPNASFNDEIGTKNDPGRRAERDFEKINARNGGNVGYEGVGDQSNIGHEGQGGFEELRRDENA